MLSSTVTFDDWISSDIWGDILEPNIEQYFQMRKDIDPYRYEISVSGVPTYEEPYKDFEIKDTYISESDRKVTITGEFTNTGASRNSIRIESVYFDSQGEIIGFDTEYLDDTDSNDSSFFEIEQSKYSLEGEYDSVKLFVISTW